jgi:hypothetical protein
MYLYNTDQLGFAANGTSVLIFGENQAYFRDGASAAAPSITFISEGGLGMRRAFAGTGALTASGGDKIIWSATGLGFNGSAAWARTSYNMVNPTTMRSMDVSSVGLAQLAQVVGTLIKDLQARGDLG